MFPFWLEVLDPKFVGLRQDHLEDRHEGGRLAEVAAAHDVGVDVEAVHVGPGLHAPRHVVQSSHDGRGELRAEQGAETGQAVSN